MFDHVGLRVRDLAASRRLYSAALAPIGYVVGPQDGGMVGTLGWLAQHPRCGSPLTTTAAARTVAVRSPNRDAVVAFHKAALAAGARDNGAPGLRADYGPSYYAAFIIDLDGNNIEAVCLT